MKRSGVCQLHGIDYVGECPDCRKLKRSTDGLTDFAAFSGEMEDPDDIPDVFSQRAADLSAIEQEIAYTPSLGIKESSIMQPEFSFAWQKAFDKYAPGWRGLPVDPRKEKLIRRALWDARIEELKKKVKGWFTIGPSRQKMRLEIAILKMQLQEAEKENIWRRKQAHKDMISIAGHLEKKHELWQRIVSCEESAKAMQQAIFAFHQKMQDTPAAAFQKRIVPVALQELKGLAIMYINKYQNKYINEMDKHS